MWNDRGLEDDEGEPRIKMHAREGLSSGDALVVLKEDSVTLTVIPMDEAELRLGDATTRMKVQKTEFVHKQQHEAGGRGEEGRRRL